MGNVLFWLWCQFRFANGKSHYAGLTGLCRFLQALESQNMMRKTSILVLIFFYIIINCKNFPTYYLQGKFCRIFHKNVNLLCKWKFSHVRSPLKKIVLKTYIPYYACHLLLGFFFYYYLVSLCASFLDFHLNYLERFFDS